MTSPSPARAWQSQSRGVESVADGMCVAVRQQNQVALKDLERLLALDLEQAPSFEHEMERRDLARRNVKTPRRVHQGEAEDRAANAERPQHVAERVGLGKRAQDTHGSPLGGSVNNCGGPAIADATCRSVVSRTTRRRR